MWDLVGNPEDRFSHNEAHIELELLYYLKAANNCVDQTGRIMQSADQPFVVHIQ